MLSSNQPRRLRHLSHQTILHKFSCELSYKLTVASGERLSAVCEDLIVDGGRFSDQPVPANCVYKHLLLLPP